MVVMVVRTNAVTVIANAAVGAVPFDAVWARLPRLVLPELHVLLEGRDPELFAVLARAGFGQIVLQATDHVLQHVQVGGLALLLLDMPCMRVRVSIGVVFCRLIANNAPTWF